MTAKHQPNQSPHTTPQRRILQTTGILTTGLSLIALSGQTLAAIASEGTKNLPVTAVFGLVRREGMTHEEFVEYFQTSHIPLTTSALADEGIELHAYRSVIPVIPDESPYDGIGELTFADLATLQQATDTAEWARALEDVPNFTQPDANAVIIGLEHDHLSNR